MKLPIQIKKILAFPSVFLPYYMSKPIIKFVYRKSTTRLRTASRKNLLRNRLIYSLEKRYEAEICYIKKNINQQSPTLPHEHSGIVWICWFQGIDKAPEVVKSCYDSICAHLGNKYKIVLLTDENWEKFSDIPVDIRKKYKDGVINRTAFSDILKWNILVKNSGTWIDATVLCTDSNPPEYMMSSELFLVQTMIPDRGTFATQIENYFISASQNDKILTLSLKLMYEYWRKYDFLLDYHLSYDLLQIAIEQYPEEWSKVVPFPRARFETFESSLDLPYNKNLYENLLAQSPFHKLSYKHTIKENSVFEHLIDSMREGKFHR